MAKAVKCCSVRATLVRDSTFSPTRGSAAGMSNSAIKPIEEDVHQIATDPPSKRLVRRFKPTSYPRNWSHLRLIHPGAAAYVCQENVCGIPHFALGWRHFDGTFTLGAESNNIPGARLITIRLALTRLDIQSPRTASQRNCGYAVSVGTIERTRKYDKSTRGVVDMERWRSATCSRLPTHLTASNSVNYSAASAFRS